MEVMGYDDCMKHSSVLLGEENKSGRYIGKRIGYFPMFMMQLSSVCRVQLSVQPAFRIEQVSRVLSE
jgi:hypothetical protein